MRQKIGFNVVNSKCYTFSFNSYLFPEIRATWTLPSRDTPRQGTALRLLRVKIFRRTRSRCCVLHFMRATQIFADCERSQIFQGPPPPSRLPTGPTRPTLCCSRPRFPWHRFPFSVPRPSTFAFSQTTKWEASLISNMGGHGRDQSLFFYLTYVKAYKTII